MSINLRVGSPPRQKPGRYERNRGAPTRIRRAHKSTAATYGMCTHPLGTWATNTSASQPITIATAANSDTFIDIRSIP